MINPRKRGLSPVLGVVLSLMFLAIVLAAGLSYRAIDRELTAAALSRRLAVSDLAAATLSAKFDHLISVGISLATRVRFRQLVAAGQWAEAIEILRDVPRDLPVVERLLLTDAAGTLTADVPELPGVRGRSFAHRDWYKGVIADGKSYVSPAYQRAAAPQANVFAVAVPIRTDGGAVAGILVLQVRLDTFFEWLKPIQIGPEGFVYVVDRQGQLAFHSKYPGRNEIVALPAVTAVQQVLRGVRSVEVTFDTAEKEDSVSAYTPVSGYGWGLIVQQPARAAFTARNEQLARLLVAYGLVLLFCGLAAYLVSRVIVQRGQAQEDRRVKTELERRVAERTANLDRANISLRESEESLAATLNSIGDAVLATDTGGLVTRMNPVAERLTGWPFAEARGRPVEEVFRIVNEQTRAPAVVPVAQVLATGEIQGLANHTMLIARDGTERPIADSAAPIRDAGGRVSGAVLVFRDVTDERGAEQVMREHNDLLEQRVRERTAQLRASEAQLRTVFENLAEGVVVSGLDGQVLHFNRAAMEMFGFASREEYLRRLPEFADTLELSTPEGTILPVDQWPLARILRAETLRELEMGTHHVRDGWRKVFSYGGTLVRGADGQPLLAVLTIRDITERKRAEQEIRDLNATLEKRVTERTLQLEEASRAKSDFLANMSHELRTPLNAIIGFSEMLKDGLLGELEAKQRRFIADIFDAGTHLLSLINDILDLSKVEAGMLQLEAGAVDLAALLKASTLVVRQKALAHRIRLDTELDPGLGIMQADERKLKQIVYNLLANAVKFSPEGGAVRLRARLCTRSEVAPDAAMPGRLIALAPGEEGEFLEISVEDGGVGIAEEHLPKLFEPFVQADSSVARRFGGTGLGLSLVRRLAELHGGTVGVASRPGAGSRFYAWLPYREAVPDARAEAAALEERSAPAVPLALVIEDDDRIAEPIEAQLRAEGFQVMRAATGEEGLVRAAKSRPQLITLDIFLPAMDGWEFMRRLKADPKLADTPVVIISVSADQDHGLALGARRVLHKPFVREELLAALAGLVQARPDGERARVLVVDDNVKAVELVATALEAERYRVLRAHGGAEAIEVARHTPPDLVILDLMMPEVSGFEVARALRESEHTARIPILVLTAKDLTAEDHARLNGDVSAILAKENFNRDALLAELRRALPKRAGD